jgi:methionine sulfoxide reductase heme-binding subunit
MTADAMWYLARGSGLVSLILLTVVVVLGIVQRSGRPLPGLPRFAVSSVHRNSGLLAIVFLCIHVLTLLVDPYAHLRLSDTVVPFASSYRPLWSGLGTLALDLIIAVTVTGLLRHRIGVRAFRAVHWLAYACWPVAFVHGLGTGTDNTRLWMVGTTVVCAIVVVLALMWRISANFVDMTSVRVTAARVAPAPVLMPARGPAHAPAPGIAPASAVRPATASATAPASARYPGRMGQ